MTTTSPRRHSSRLRAAARLTAAAFFFSTAAAGIALAAPPASAEAGSVTGTATSGDGSAVSGASVTLRGASGTATARTDRSGRFTIAGLAPGVYAIRTDAPGYDATTGRVVDVTRAGTTNLRLALEHAAAALVTIGRTQSIAGASGSLSTSSAPSTILDPQSFAARGVTTMTDVLQDDISTTLVHPLGSNSALPTSVALRGPDPTETLIAIDGHRVNNGNTGDFDLSLLDPVQYGAVELVKGISPSSLVGPDTIDGAVNVQTLEPTARPHGLARFTLGSYNAFGETVQTTGTADRLGYALSLHRTTTDGEVHQTILDNTNGGAPASVGSAVDASTALAKLRYAFGAREDAYAELSFRDQTQFRDLSAALSTVATTGDVSIAPLLNGFEGTTLAAHDAGYGVDVRMPIGATQSDGTRRATVLYRHYSSYVAQSVDGPGAGTSPYLFDDRDAIDDESLEVDRRFANASLTFQYDLRDETLATGFLSGTVNDQARGRRAAPLAAARGLATASGAGAISTIDLAQTQRSAVLRYAYDPSALVHLTAALYDSRFSAFGTSVDPRFGAVVTPDARTAVRFSVGTTYQAPQLPELYVPAVLPVVVGAAIPTGNPNLEPDRATEYGLGFDRVVATGEHRTTVSLDLYRVNLRTPASTFLPNVDPTCGPLGSGGDGTPCPKTFTINAGDAVYEGFELQGERRLAPFATLSAGYAERSAYLTNVPAAIANGSLVPHQQSLGLPLQKATLSLAVAPPSGFGGYATIVYEGAYNDLNQPPFATLDAGLAYRAGALEFSLSGRNLTDAYDARFTRPVGGVPYGGTDGPVATSAYALEGPAVTFGVTRRF